MHEPNTVQRVRLIVAYRLNHTPRSAKRHVTTTFLRITLVLGYLFVASLLLGPVKGAVWRGRSGFGSEITFGAFEWLYRSVHVLREEVDYGKTDINRYVDYALNPRGVMWSLAAFLITTALFLITWRAITKRHKAIQAPTLQKNLP